MECPFCDDPLVEIILLNETDLKLINSLPYVIAYPLKKTILEKHAWTKINLLKDTFLNYLKYIGLITATEFFNSHLKHKKMVALFQQALTEPSFGSWNQYIRETLIFLSENNHNFFCTDILVYYEQVETGKKRKLFKGEIEYIDSNGDVQLKKQEATAIGMLINFRNRYLGHGLTLDDADAKRLWEEYYPIFKELLEQLTFAKTHPMYKHEHGETFKLQSAELSTIEKGTQTSARVWIENTKGQSLDILPFFVVPGELSLAKEGKEQILAYESYTGKTIKFFSPEGTEKHTSGKILEKLKLLLRDKQKEENYTPETFTKEIFLDRIADEQNLILNTLIEEKKYIPGVYINREEIEIKLREWIGARANVFFIAAEAGGGKTNLLIEMQRQYATKNLPVLFIRAARMEKLSLREQIAYLLNIQPEISLEDYQSISGTQEKPTFILIDGLNESSQAESIWEEIIDISKQSIPGSLKFVVSSRANTSEYLNNYKLTEKDENYLYGEKKEGYSGLAAYTFWLPALNMAEMKSAWEEFTKKDKNKFKPQFSFDDLATFDRSVYNIISNPLVLRIFLETYNGKSLPKKSNKNLNIWQDWLSTFSENEVSFLKLLAQAVWDNSENELLLDDLLNNANLAPYITNDLINSPYPRLKNLGWISRYSKDLNVYISFTVEGSLHYLMGSALTQQQVTLNFESLKRIMIEGTKIQIAAVENYLCQMALKKELELVNELIDAGKEFHKACISPLIVFAKLYGIKSLNNNLLARATDNDLIIFSSLLDLLDDMQMFEYKKELSIEILKIPRTHQIKLPLNLKISILDQLNYQEAAALLIEIEKEIELNNNDIEISNKHKENLAFYYSMNGYSDRAIAIYESLFEKTQLKDPKVLNKVGVAYDNCNLNEEALKYYNAALDAINISVISNSHVAAMIYFNLARFQENNELKLEYYNKALNIEKNIYGIIHEQPCRTLAAIGLTYIKLGDYERGFIKLKEALEITESLKSDLTEIYNYFGFFYKEIKDYDKSIEYYEKTFLILCEKLGDNSKSLISQLQTMGELFYLIGDDQKSLNYFTKAEQILKISGIKDCDSLFFLKNSLGVTNFYLSNYDASIYCFSNALNLFKENKSPYQEKEINTTYYYLGYSYYCKSEYETANSVLNKLSDIPIESISRATYFDNYELIGNSFFHSGKYKDAIDSYIKIIPHCDSMRDNIRITEYIGACYEYLEQYESAISNYLRIIDIDVKDLSELENIFWRIGYCQFKINSFENAIKNLEICYSQNQHAIYAFYLAKCFESIGNFDSSFEYYMQSAKTRNVDPELGPKHESTIEAVKNTLRLAKIIGKQAELPIWIKNIIK